MSASVPIKTVTGRGLTCEGFAINNQIAEVAEDGYGDLLGLEELLRQRLNVGGGYSFDGGDDLVDRVETAEVHLLTGKV